MKTYRPTSKGFVSIGTVMDKVLAQCRPNANQALTQIWDRWEAAVGSDVASNARPAAFKGDLLLIHVSNSSLLYHLHILQNDLIRKINLALGGEYVRRVKFKIGPC